MSALRGEVTTNKQPASLLLLFEDFFRRCCDVGADEYYRLRPKIEGLFSLLKRVSEGYCWSRGRPRTDVPVSTAWQNELLCKFIYLNLRTTVQLQEQTGVSIDYLLSSRFFPPPDEPLIRKEI
jgi:hypothetical protein